MVNDDIYSFKFSTQPKGSINSICVGRDKSKTNYCEMSACPVAVAGYIWYLKNKRNSEKTTIEEVNSITDNDIYVRNYNELKKFNLDSDLENLLIPLASPNIKGLRCAFIGEDGTDRDGAIKKVADYLYRIGKISSSKAIELNLSSNFVFEDDRLYLITDVQDYLDIINNNDDFSSSAETGRKANRNNIKKIVNQTKGKYIIVNCNALEFKKFIATNAKLPYIFDNTIYFKDYDNEQILQMFENNLPDYHKQNMKDDTRKLILEYLEKNRKHFPFKNEELSSFLAGYVSRKNDIQLPKERYKEITLEEMFSNLIGMNNVKQQITELSSFLKLQKQLEKMGKEIPSFNLHMMFLGNPGTRKNNSC